MRLAAAACALAILVCVAVVGAVLAQKTSVPASAPRPGTRHAGPGANWPGRGHGTDRAGCGACPADRRPRHALRRRTAPIAPRRSRHAAAPIAAAAAPIWRQSRSRQPRRHRRAPHRRPHRLRRTAASAGLVPGQPECARRRAHGRDRHHRRPGLRLRAFQEPRLPARRRGRADLRRRPVAEAHAGGARGARRALHQGDLLPDRQACDLRARHPQAGRRRRPRGRQPHLVATRTCRRPRAAVRQAEADDQGRDREGHQRGALGGRRADRAVSSASRRCGIRRSWSRISASATSRIFSTDFDSFDFKMRKPEQVRKAVMAKLKKHGKGIVLMHDFQQAHRRRRRRAAQRSQGRRLQDRAHEAEGPGDDDRVLRRDDPQGREAADGRAAARPRAWCARSASSRARIAFVVPGLSRQLSGSRTHPL